MRQIKDCPKFVCFGLLILLFFLIIVIQTDTGNAQTENKSAQPDTLLANTYFAKQILPLCRPIVCYLCAHHQLTSRPT